MEGVFIDVNDYTLSVLDYTKHELVGKPLKTMCAPNSHYKKDIVFVKCKTTGYLQNELVKIVNKNGEQRLVLLSVEAIKDQD